jgi:hypothetical protein
MLPGMESLPGVGGLNNMVGNFFGGNNNPSWEQQFGPGGNISSQMAAYDPATMGPQRQGAPQGQGFGQQRPPWMA